MPRQRHAFPRALALVVLLGIPVLPKALAVDASTAPSTPGALQGRADDGTLVDMPLRHTRVEVDVSAFVARTVVEQTFHNPFDEPIEAVYTFPLGDSAAVDDFELRTRDRVVRGRILERGAARQVYETARLDGYTAALLEQDRPNVFVQWVANLEPGSDVHVRLRTVEVLPYTDGVYEYLFPLVVGPRYIPAGEPDGFDSALAGETAAMNPWRLTPPLSLPGRSGHEVDITVTLDAGVPIAWLASRSHRIQEERLSAHAARVWLQPDDRIPNKDFILRWEVSAEEPEIGLLTHRDGGGGTFALLVQPRGTVSKLEAAPKEIVLVLDTSGSMAGAPLRAAKRFVRRALETLGPRDRFNLIRFSTRAETFAGRARDNDPAAVQQALDWVDRLQGNGGTLMLSGLRAAFEAPEDPDRLRMVVFLTDGFIGNDEEILRAVSTHVGEARVFSLGIGSSVNHYLLDRMADLGRGAYELLLPDEDPEEAVDRFAAWVTRPYLTDLEVDWGALQVEELIPERPSDLYSGQTLAVVGRYFGAQRDAITIRGRLAGAYWEQTVPVDFPEHAPEHAALASVWARWKIDALLQPRDGEAPPTDVREQVTALALEHRLMSPFTSFVAVDESVRVNPGGEGSTLRQAVPVPDSVDAERVASAAGEFTERVAVRGMRDVVDLARTETATRFTDEFISELPVAGRFYQNVVTLAHGVQDPARYASATVSGSRSRDFEVMVSGVSSSDPLTGGFASNANANSIEDMEVVTAGAGVRFGRAPGGFANVIQAQGGNEHEADFELLWRSSLLDDDGATTPRAGSGPSHESWFPSIYSSGPLIEDRLWYRAAHAWHHAEDPVHATDRIERVTREGWSAADRLTWQVSDRNKLALLFRSDPLRIDNVGANLLHRPGSTRALERNDSAWSVVWQVPHSPRAYVETNASYRYLSSEVGPEDPAARSACAATAPRCIDMVAGAIDGRAPRRFVDRFRAFELRSRASWYPRNGHQLELGTELTSWQHDRDLTRDPTLWRLPSGGATLLLRVGTPAFSRAGVEGSGWSLWAEDQFTPVAQLRLRFGLWVGRETVDGIEQIENTNAAPFVGLSWDPWSNGRTKLSASWGRHYHDLGPAPLLVAAEPDTVDVELSSVAATAPDLTGLPRNVQQVDPGLRTPYADELTLGFERELWAETALRLTWVDRRLEDQLRDVELEAPEPGLGDVFLLGSSGSGRHEAWKLELERRQYRGWEMKASWVRSERTSDGEAFDPYLGDERTLVADVDGHAPDDIRHVVQASAVSITPWGIRLGGLLRWSSGLRYSEQSWRLVTDPVTGQRHPRLDTHGRRNGLRNRSYWDVDLRVSKLLALGQGSLELSLEGFNLLNDGALWIYDPAREAGRTLNGFAETTRRFGRRWQLGLRYSF